MGTRALVVVKEPDNTELAVIYSQWDGYPSGLGKTLGEILGKYEVGNGIPMRKVFPKPFANGVNELIIHLLVELKRREWDHAAKTAKIVKSPNSYPLPEDQYPAQIGHKPGGYYLYPAGIRDAGEEWIYIVEAKDGKVWVQVREATSKAMGRGEAEQKDGELVWECWARDLAKKAWKEEE